MAGMGARDGRGRAGWTHAAALGGGTVALGLAFAPIAPVFTPTLVSLGIFLVAAIAIERRKASVLGLTEASMQAITNGHYVEAEEILASIPLSAHAVADGLVGCLVAHQRALVAFYRGDPEAAIDALGPVIAPTRLGLLADPTRQALHHSMGLALRSLAYAAIGDAARAEADARAAESIGEMDPSALARVALARAVVLARAADHDRLAAHLAKHAPVILETAKPRERVLLRALRRLATSRGKSVYREPSRPNEGTTPMAEWVARIVPTARDYVEVDATVDAGVVTADAPATEDAMEPVAPKRPSLAVGIIVAAAGVGVGLGIVASRHSGGHGTLGSLNLLDGIFVMAAFQAVAMIAFVVAKKVTRRTNLALLAAQRAAAHGDDRDAVRLLTPLSESSLLAVRTAALLGLAMVAERRAELGRAIVLGAKALVPYERDRALDDQELVPQILLVRAVSFAGLGRIDEAMAELRRILVEHDTWANLAVADLRVRFLVALKVGDDAAAHALAKARRADMPLPMRDDILCDLFLATIDGCSDGERARLEGELAGDERLARWIDTVAPSLRTRVARPRVASDALRLASGHGGAQHPEPRSDEDAAKEEEEEEEAVLEDMPGAARRRSLPRP